MAVQINEERIKEVLESGKDKARILLADDGKMQHFLDRLEVKLREVPVAGDALAYAPIMGSMLRSYATKEYTEIPMGSMLAVTSALIYFVSPIDIVPDTIPGVGYIDDAAVIGLCVKLVQSDLNDFVAWRENK